MFKSVDPNVDFISLEKDLLNKWEKEDLYKKYLNKNQKSGKKFSFLDGPITANNPMGVHHGWGRTYKDLWQRYWNMRGYKQRFQNGFDCQGLWVEVEVEKELGVRTKKDIENLVEGQRDASIAKFVDLCKERVIKFSKIQTEQSRRLGYFMDWDNSYYTMSDQNNYAIWGFLKKCFEKGWIYKGEDSVPWCPRCETAISQHEMLTEDYKELTHETVFVKLPIVDKNFSNTSLLIWTTTPWTVPANVAVGVNIKFTYAIWENQTTHERLIILDKDENGNDPIRIKKNKNLTVSDYIFSGLDDNFEKVKQISGSDLIGVKYEAPFDHIDLIQNAKKSQKFHTVIDGSEIVTSLEGTGLLHVAPGAGKEDYDLGKKEDLPVISVITDTASYVNNMNEFSKLNAKKHPEIIIDYLRNTERSKYLLRSLNYTHRYPACWRCRTELVWKVAKEWYIAMDKKDDSGLTYRQQMIKIAKKIDWMPAWGLSRELDWLDNLHDWLISKKNRYWGLALPIYECKKCSKFEVIGSYEELKDRAVDGWKQFENKSPHKPYIDNVLIECNKCNSKIKRIDDVGNVWLDAGIVSVSTVPEDFRPADFITESFPGQFKNWFYSLIAMSTVLRSDIPTKKILGYASVLAEDGRAMHKSWGNSIEFNEGADKIGVDVMRWMYISNDPEQNLLFGYKKGDETRRKILIMIWNIYNFFVTYSNIDKFSTNKMPKSFTNPLDRWILSRLELLISNVTLHLESYEPKLATIEIEEFISDLSTWYIRRSRDRVGPDSDNVSDRNSCHAALFVVISELMKILAPFMPFVSDYIFSSLNTEKSVHLESWPDVGGLRDKEVEADMIIARKVVELGNSMRKDQKVKNRQPLSALCYEIKDESIRDQEIINIILEELNIKSFIDKKELNKLKKISSVTSKKSENIEVWIDFNLTEDLLEEGRAREIVRQIQSERKKVGTGIDEFVNVVLPNWPNKHGEYIKKKALIKNLNKGDEFELSRL